MSWLDTLLDEFKSKGKVTAITPEGVTYVDELGPSLDWIELMVRLERGRQHGKWGEQNWPDGTGSALQQNMAKLAKVSCDAAHKNGKVTWAHILSEEISEVFAEKDSKRLQEELIQVMAVCKQWHEAISRRRQRG